MYSSKFKLAHAKVNPLVHFGLCNGTRSSPTVRFFSPEGVESELRCAAREFFQGDGMEVDLEKRTVYLTRIIKWWVTNCLVFPTILTFTDIANQATHDSYIVRYWSFQTEFLHVLFPLQVQCGFWKWQRNTKVDPQLLGCN